MRAFRPFVATRFGSAVCGSTRYRPASPETCESNTICWPSGDHLGVPLNEWKLLNCKASLPSRFDTHTSCEPERSDSKTMRLPSGDIWGCRSWPEVGNIRDVDASAGRRRSTRQRLTFAFPCE